MESSLCATKHQNNRDLLALLAEKTKYQFPRMSIDFINNQ